MERHAATKWLTTEMGVVPGEEIELVFAIWDMADPRLDAYVLLDNFRWGCTQTVKPITVPVL